jgi:hypothetical protein
MLRAALHIHSTYSDGEYSPAELKRVFVAEGCAIVGITDHAESFDKAKLADYIGECAALSGDRFTFLCGLEYRCEQGMHILAYGVTAMAQTRDPQEVIRHIEEHGGLAVIAHPQDSAFPLIESFRVLPGGIETWNTKYDGRYAPRPKTFELLRRLRARRPGMTAFYGQDLHWKKQFRGLFTQLQCESLTRDEILGGLFARKYSAVKADLSLPSSGEISPELVARFAAKHAQSDKMRNFLKTGKNALEKLGIPAPISIKSYVRNLF